MTGKECFCFASTAGPGKYENCKSLRVQSDSAYVTQGIGQASKAGKLLARGGRRAPGCCFSLGNASELLGGCGFLGSLLVDLLSLRLLDGIAKFLLNAAEDGPVFVAVLLRVLVELVRELLLLVRCNGRNAGEAWLVALGLVRSASQDRRVISSTTTDNWENPYLMGPEACCDMYSFDMWRA